MIRKLLFIFILSSSIILTGCGDKNTDLTEEVPNEPSEVSETEAPAQPIALTEENKPVVPEVIISGTESFYTDAVIISNPESITALVNRTYNLPSDYVPSDLVKVEIPFVDGRMDEVKQMRSEASEALSKLFAAASENELYLYGASGYRSYSTQKVLFNNNVAKRGSVEAANKVSALPGQSEHQTGLVMDVTAESVNYGLLESFADTPEGIWLAGNAHLYGFIIRYPKDKTDITGYNYEPWHCRYLGVELATELFEKGITLDEYFVR